MHYNIAENKINEIINSEISDKLQKIVDFLYNNFDHYSWIGIYIAQGDHLVLGPWNGEQATVHTKIPFGKGICGSAAATGKTEIIPDVNDDTRYLSCFLSTNSEIVVPIKRDNEIIAEIDIDSNKKNAFSNEDKIFLEKIADMLKEHI